MWYWQRYREKSGRLERHRPRLDRGSLLEVRARWSDRQRERWHRLGAIVLLLLALAGLAWLGTAGVRQLGRAFFSENPHFTIRHLDLASDGKLAPAYIREYARLETGVNLFAVDLRQVRRDLESVPVVSRATVRRVLPDTLRVRVSERVAVARLGDEAGGPPLAVDREGYVLGPASVSTRLPVIAGYPARGLRPGSGVKDPGVHSALQLLEMSNEPVFSRFLRIRRVEVSGGGTLIVQLERGEKVRLPQTNLRHRLERLCEIIKQSADEGRAIASVDMTLERNFPVIYQ